VPFHIATVPEFPTAHAVLASRANTSHNIDVVGCGVTGAHVWALAEKQKNKRSDKKQLRRTVIICAGFAVDKYA
jgi:hypothetical protein